MGEVRIILDSATHGELLRVSKILGLTVSEAAGRAVVRGLPALANLATGQERIAR